MAGFINCFPELATVSVRQSFSTSISLKLINMIFTILLAVPVVPAASSTNMFMYTGLLLLDKVTGHSFHTTYFRTTSDAGNRETSHDNTLPA